MWDTRPVYVAAAEAARVNRMLPTMLTGDQQAFRRKLRRFTMLVAAVGLCAMGALLWPYLRGRRQQNRIGAATALSRAQGAGQPTAVREQAGPDSSQLVPRAVLDDVSDVGRVRRTGSRAKRQSIIDHDRLCRVLAILKGTSQQELLARVDESIRWEDFLDPQRRARIRGRVCRFRGTLRGDLKECQAVELSEVGLEHLYEGRLQDSVGRWYGFYCLEKPPRQIVRTGVAELVGVFYKLIVSPTRGGGEIVAPLIVARTVTARKAYGPPRPLTALLVEDAPPWALALGAFFVVAAIFGVMTVLMRRRPARRLARRGSGEGPDLPKPDRQ